LGSPSFDLPLHLTRTRLPGAGARSRVGHVWVSCSSVVTTDVSERRRTRVGPGPNKHLSGSRVLVPWNPGVPERVQLRDLLAPQLVAFATLQPFQHPAYARGQFEGVEGLEDVVDRAKVEPALGL
jgi:hypothetical protein